MNTTNITDTFKPTRLDWDRNAGQYHHTVYAVAQWPEHWHYPGAGAISLTVNEDGEVTGFADYNRLPSEPDVFDLEGYLPHQAHVVAANFKIIAEKGTCAADMIERGAL